jgi:hypothetical protein
VIKGASCIIWDIVAIVESFHDQALMFPEAGTESMEKDLVENPPHDFFVSHQIFIYLFEVKYHGCRSKDPIKMFCNAVLIADGQILEAVFAVHQLH